ncbi:MAG: hypothetical protein KGZ49_13255 [Syntrophaceae bacterium]|nr:hypothetical protein [Syntrophaceae bacterium]
MNKINFRKGLVVKLFIFLIAIVVSTPVIYSGQVLAQTAQLVPCKDQLTMYKADIHTPGLAQAAQGWDCPDPNARVMPVPKKQASKSGTGYGGYGKQDFQMQMMQGILGALFQSVFAPPPGPDPYQEQLKKQQELLMKQEQEKQKQQALEAWKKLQANEAAKLSADDAQKRQQGDALLAKMGKGGSIGGGGGLRPFNWDAPRAEFTPLSAGRYDTSGLSSWQRLLCASHFSNMALKSGSPEGAVFMNRQADIVTVGGMTEVECSFPAMPQAPEPQQHEAKMQKITGILEAVQMKIKDLQDIEVKLAEAKQQKQEAQTKLKEAEAKVSEIKNRPKDVSNPEEKAQDDDFLVQQALAELNSAKEQIVTAEQNEQKYEEMKNKNLDEIKNMEQQAMKEFK